MTTTTDRPWWLEGNYRPVREEVEATALEVEGRLPPELDGLYLRNGANPKHALPSHWFLGDGMVHGVRLRRGKATEYRNRWVRTELLDAPPAEGLQLPTLTQTRANVSLVHHAGRLLALGEVGLPYELRTGDLSTVGWYDFAGKLETHMTAHPKVDPVTGELLFFGYDWKPPHLTFHRADASGALVRSIPIATRGPSMQHDFAITERYVVFMDLPIVFDFDLALAGAFPFKWSDTHGARFGVLPRSAEHDAVRWLEIDPCFIFHTMNAFEDGGAIVLDAARYERLWRNGPEDFDALPSLYRYRIDLERGTVQATQLDDRFVEFPQLDPRRVGRAYRYGYALRADAQLAPGRPFDADATSGVVKVDHATGQVIAFDFPRGELPGEVSFVPAGERAGEDEGWLVGYAYVPARDASDLVVLDARDVAAGPVARVKLPVRVPYGFHGTWVETG